MEKNTNRAAAGNSRIVKDSINTGGNYGSNGLLNPADAEAFIKMIQDDSSFLGKLSSETVGRISGNISKLGVGSRLLRRFTETEDNVTGHEVMPVIGNVPYTCERMVLGSAISEEWFQENKAKEGFETMFMGQIADQIKVDILDLAFNGDEAAAESVEDKDFIRLNDGYIKQIKAGGNVVDGSTIGGGKFDRKMFYSLRRAVPEKYRNGNFRWICSDDTYTDLCEYLSDRPTSLGDISIVDGRNIKILETGFERVSRFPSDVIIYADPKNLKVVYFGEIRHRKTTEGKEAIYRDMRYYADHMAIDYIIREVKATAILTNRGTLAA